MNIQKPDPFWGQFDGVIDRNQLSVFLIAHTQPPRGHLNMAQLQCSESERFSVEEFNEIYQGIVTAGFYVQGVYFNEFDFILDYTEHPERFHSCLIYNLARNGKGNNKKTLIPAFCELVNLRYTSSASLSCALCRNKYLFTTLLRAHNIPVPNSWLLSKNGSWENGAPPNDTHVICKPCSESASQGIDETGVFTTATDLFECFYGTECIVQEFVDGIECEVPVFRIGNQTIALPPVGIDLRGRCILDEQASNEYLYDFYPLSNVVSPNAVEAICECAKKAFNLLQMDVYGRIDFRINSQGIPYIFDVSTMPYTIKHSSFAYDFYQLGYSYSDIYQAIISAALQRK